MSDRSGRDALRSAARRSPGRQPFGQQPRVRDDRCGDSSAPFRSTRAAQPRTPRPPRSTTTARGCGAATHVVSLSTGIRHIHRHAPPPHQRPLRFRWPIVKVQDCVYSMTPSLWPRALLKDSCGGFWLCRSDFSTLLDDQQSPTIAIPPRPGLLGRNADCPYCYASPGGDSHRRELKMCLRDTSAVAPR